MTDLTLALGQIPSGLFIVTIKSEEIRAAMLGSWIMQASFNPPMVTVAVNKERGLKQWLNVGVRLAVNILSERDKANLLHFSRANDPRHALDGVSLIPMLPDHAPVLASALSFLEGRIVGSLETGDHVVYSVSLEHGRRLNQGAPAVHIRKSGDHY